MFELINSAGHIVAEAMSGLQIVEKSSSGPSQRTTDMKLHLSQY